MKYYSEKTKEIYDSPELLAEAERKYSDMNTNKRMAKAIKEEMKVASKKQLAANVEAAEAKVDEARANLELAKQKAQEISKKYLEEIDQLMEPAKQQLKDAQKIRYEAIQKFNDAYGAYTTSYTGARAADEFARAVSEMSSFFPSIFRF